MADAKISALTAASSLDGTEAVPIAQAGSTLKMTLAQVNAYCEPICNTSVATQSVTAATDTYVTGSGITLPVTRLQAKSLYICKIQVSKTAAGTAAPVFNIRLGTAGTTADTSRTSHTGSSQTAAVDNGLFEVAVVFNSVGSGTSAVVRTSLTLVHQSASAGLCSGNGISSSAVSSGFDSTVAGSILGVSLNSGTSAVWTINQVYAQLLNIL